MYASLQSANETVVEAKELVVAAWKKMAEEGPTQQEMDEAINYLIGSYALQMASSKGIAGILSGLQIVGLPSSYPTDREALFRALTLDDLKRVAARVYDADALTIVATGSPQGDIGLTAE